MKEKSVSNYIRKWGKKLKAIGLLGGKCETCSEIRPGVLEFHHINKDEKEIGIKDLLAGRWTSILEELKKCKLLCGNCHRKHHFIENTEKRTNQRPVINKEIFLEFKGEISCKLCGYSDCVACLCFHHRDAEDKKFQLATVYVTESFKSLAELSTTVQDEINKCDLLCINCHKHEHFDLDKFYSHQKEIYSNMESYKELPPKYDRQKIIELKDTGLKNSEISRILGCTKSTITHALKTSYV